MNAAPETARPPAWPLRIATTIGLLCWLGQQPPLLAQGAGLSLHIIPTDTEDSVDLTVAAPILVVLEVANAERFADIFELAGTQIVDAEHVRLQLPDDVTLEGLPEERHLQSSWVVDYDEFEQLIGPSELQPRPLAGSAVQAVRHLTETLLPERTSRHGLLIASQAVSIGGGDCTEHAVVAAAIARQRGIPARVVVGWALVQVHEDASILGYTTAGHAWAEIWLDNRWQIVDTALQPTTPDPELAEMGAELTIRYLPQFEWRNEGPGYGAWVLERVVNRPTRVILAPSRMPGVRDRQNGSADPAR